MEYTVLFRMAFALSHRINKVYPKIHLKFSIRKGRENLYNIGNPRSQQLGTQQLSAGASVRWPRSHFLTPLCPAERSTSWNCWKSEHPFTFWTHAEVPHETEHLTLPCRSQPFPFPQALVSSTDSDPTRFSTITWTSHHERAARGQARKPSPAHGERRPVPGWTQQGSLQHRGHSALPRDNHRRNTHNALTPSDRLHCTLWTIYTGPSPNVFLYKIGKHQKQVSDVLQLFTRAFLLLCINNLIKLWHAT